ncbi:MAG: hypothetical protein NVS1B2_16090 [Vulcanimicrobiaceae bacterium]
MDVGEESVGLEVAHARDHVAAIAKASRVLLRLKDELDVHKANMKLAQIEFDRAVMLARDYSDTQMRFEFNEAT